MLDALETYRHLEQIVSEKGDSYVYEPVASEGFSSVCEAVYEPVASEGFSSVCEAFSSVCVYFHDNQPSCGVGHVFDRVGITLSDLERMCGSDANVSSVQRDSRLIRGLGEWFTPGALLVLAAFQTAQDRSKSWGEALIAAKERLDRVGDHG